MSQTHLPDDLRLWPSDPYVLLDVSQTADKRAARSAYTRLIRSFKPERFPDEFRRIREAYETVLQRIEWRDFVGRSGVVLEETDGAADDETKANTSESRDGANGTTSPETTSSHPRPAAKPPARAESPPEALPEPQRDAPPPVEPARDTRPVAPRPPAATPEELARQKLADELDTLWQRSCDGEHAAVYARLLELATHNPGHDGIVVRLYWLLRVSPELDKQRTAVGWLVYGLRTNHLRGPLLELYRREIDATPVEATRDRCTRLLQLPLAEPRALAALCEYRWLAAARLGAWPMIGGDLELLAPRLKHGDEPLWAGLLLSAIDQLAWAPRGQYGPLVEKCCQELEAMHHVQTMFSQAFDRLDCLLQVSQGWHKLVDQHTMPEHLLQAVPLSWRGPEEESQALGLQIVEQFARSPEKALWLLDRMWEGSPAVVGQLGAFISRQRRYDSEQAEDKRDEHVLAPLVRSFFLDTMPDAYQFIRPRLLAFCIGEAIAPEQVAGILLNMPELRVRQNQDMAEILNADRPLQYAHLAHDVFWS